MAVPKTSYPAKKIISSHLFDLVKLSEKSLLLSYALPYLRKAFSRSFFVKGYPAFPMPTHAQGGLQNFLSLYPDNSVWLVRLKVSD